ncbi:MAG: hypothetical protein WBQ94_03530 [Terracidiphilus sp.]
MRDGGYFSKDGFQGYRDVLSIGGESCWALMMWESAERFGTAWRWYKDHTDEITDLVTLGQYPFKGRYRVLKKFIHRELINGEWVVTRLEPTHFILDVMVPMIKGWNKLSNQQRLEIIEREQEEEERQADKFLEDARAAHHIRRDSPMVQKRAELMERTMSQAIALARRTQTGMRQTGA